MTVTWENAPAAHGKKLMEWVDKNHLPLWQLKTLEKGLERRLNDWRRGGRARFDVVDRFLTLMGHHVSELPDEVWAEIHIERGHLGAIRPQPLQTVEVEPRDCAECGKEIPRRRPGGKLVHVSDYQKLKFCCRECGWENQKGKSRVYSPTFNSGRFGGSPEEFVDDDFDGPLSGRMVA